jgi:hypothetical protein
MARDKIHEPFKIALEDDGWEVTDDPLYLKIGTIPIHIDLGAEKLIAAEKDSEKIAVEIKTFGNTSFITALYEAVGKYVIYRKALEILRPDRVLYLAVPKDVYKSVSRELILREVFKDEKIKLILYDTEFKIITKWIK